MKIPSFKIPGYKIYETLFRRKWIFALCIGWMCMACPAATIAQQNEATLNIIEKFVYKGQRFSCSADFPQTQCMRELLAIRDQLAVYHAEQLGPWAWVLVSAQDWKPLMKGLGLRTISPAITSAADRETLVEESLFAPSLRRAFELTMEFHISSQEILSRTLSHELGHAFCDDRDEARTERVAEQIRDGLQPRCDAPRIRAAESVKRSSGK